MGSRCPCSSALAPRCTPSCKLRGGQAGGRSLFFMGTRRDQGAGGGGSQVALLLSSLSWEKPVQPVGSVTGMAAVAGKVSANGAALPPRVLGEGEEERRTLSCLGRRRQLLLLCPTGDPEMAAAQQTSLPEKPLLGCTIRAPKRPCL